MSDKKEPKKRGRPPKAVEPIVDVIEPAMKAMVIGLLPNPTWVRGKIDGFGVNIKVPAQLSKRLIGKEINVILVNSDIDDYYQYIA